MKNPSIRKNRFQKNEFTETSWTKSSKSLGEYIFRRISLDQSNSELKNIRPRHCLSKLIVSSNEIDHYVNEYFVMLSRKNGKSKTQKIAKNSKSLDRYFVSDSIFRS